MPAKSQKQAKAAQLEYIRRTIEKQPKQRKNIKNKRAFGTATKEQLQHFFTVE